MTCYLLYLTQSVVRDSVTSLSSRKRVCYKSEFQWRFILCAHFVIYWSTLSWYEHNDLLFFITHLYIATISIKIHFCVIFPKVAEQRKRQGNFFFNLGYYVLCSYRSIKVIPNYVFLFWALSTAQNRRTADNLPLWSAQVRLHTLPARILSPLMANLIQFFTNTAIVIWVRTKSGLPHSTPYTATVQLHSHWNVWNIDFRYSFVFYTVLMWTFFLNALEQNNGRYRHSNELCFIREMCQYIRRNCLMEQRIISVAS